MSPVNKQLLQILLLLASLNIIRSKCPQATFDSARVRACTSTSCISEIIVRGCIGPETVLPDTTSVTINSNDTYWRRGAIHDLPELYYVSTLDSYVSRLNPGVFLNLPKLEKVNLQFNDIEEILWGVFSDTSISEIDLQWNLISSVEDEAFSNMPNLIRILLSRNKLKELWQSWFKNSNNITSIIMSYNEIEKIQFFTFEIFPNLKYLDLSFNRIKEIGPNVFNNIKHLEMLDLTSNRLSWVKPDVFKSEIIIDVLRLPLNLMSFLSTRFLEQGNVKSLVLHPNPWQCPCLNEVLKWMHEHNVTLVDPSEDPRIKYDSTLPECSINSKSRDKCVVGYDDAFLRAQEIFFREVNYSTSVWEKPTAARPNFHVLQVDEQPLSGEFSPLFK